MTKAIGWYSGNPLIYFQDPPAYPSGSFDPNNAGVVLTDDFINAEKYFAGISEAPGGVVVWTPTWTPVGSDPAPTLTEPLGAGVGLVQIGPFFAPKPVGLLTITATIDGVSLPGHLEWVGSTGGDYGQSAWQGVDNNPPPPPPKALWNQEDPFVLETGCADTEGLFTEGALRWGPCQLNTPLGDLPATPPMSSASATIPVGRETRDYHVTLSSVGAGPLTLSSVEWVGQLFYRARRL